MDGMAMEKLELVEVEDPDSAGLVLIANVLAKLGVGLGDTVYLTETPTGVTLSSSPPGDRSGHAR